MYPANDAFYGNDEEFDEIFPEYVPPPEEIPLG